jgi:hypothetical protein
VLDVRQAGRTEQLAEIAQQTTRILEQHTGALYQGLAALHIRPCRGALPVATVGRGSLDLFCVGYGRAPRCECRWG